MTSITFDKLAYVDRLKKSGVPEEQARAQAEALDVALNDTVATRADIARLEGKIDLVAERTGAELRLVKWMLALVIAATVIPLIQQFF